MRIEHGHAQPGDERYGDVCVDAKPHEIIRDEAVEQRAEHVLCVEWEGGSQTEQRMRGHGIGGDDRGDEREPVCRARDIAIGQAWPPGHLYPRAGRQLISASFDDGPEGLYLLAFEHASPRPAFPERNEETSVIAGVQLTSERAFQRWVTHPDGAPICSRIHISAGTESHDREFVSPYRRRKRPAHVKVALDQGRGGITRAVVDGPNAMDDIGRLAGRAVINTKRTLGVSERYVAMSRPIPAIDANS